MRMHSALVLVVGLALLGGVLAFEGATPDHGVRPQRAELGFERLDRLQLRGSASVAARTHRAAMERRAAHAAARLVATRWLARPVRVASAGPSVGRFVAWVDGVPHARRRVELGRVELATDLSRASAGGTIELRLADAEVGTRVDRIPVELELVARGRGWRVDRAEASGGSILRELLDPVLVSAGGVDVMAETADVVAARRVAARASLVSARFADRFGTLAPRDSWLVRLVPATSGASTPATGIVVLPVGGDPVPFVVDRAIARLAEVAPPILVAGIRDRELERFGASGSGEAATGRRDLLRAFAQGRSGLADALRGSGPVDPAVSGALIDWLGARPRGDAVPRVLERLAEGHGLEDAVQRTVGLDPRGVEVAVARWLRAAADEDRTRATTSA